MMSDAAEQRYRKPPFLRHCDDFSRAMSRSTGNRSATNRPINKLFVGRPKPLANTKLQLQGSFLKAASELKAGSRNITPNRASQM
ncbi:MAG: hypothetical protein U1B82_24195 [Cypionkella sp.]|nr:hypothetical protein [Cypionkella sp.]